MKYSKLATVQKKQNLALLVGAGKNFALASGNPEKFSEITPYRKRKNHGSLF